MEKLMGDEKAPEGPTQDQATEILKEAAEDLNKKLGDGTRIVIMAGRGAAGTWGYCWSVRGDSFGVLGLLKYGGGKIKEWFATNLK